MPKALDLTGQRFSHLVAQYRVPNHGKKTYWHCICDCGKEKDIQTSHLTCGTTTSCGECSYSGGKENNFTKNFISKEVQCPICERKFINKHPNRIFCYDCIPESAPPEKRAYYKQKAVKHQLVLYKGGRCERCGYDRYKGALEFHHKNPQEKDFSISQFHFNSTIGTMEVFKKEVDKCELLCANCHREEHHRLDMEE